MIKWVAAAIGYSFLRFPGAILGFMVGGFFEHLTKNSVQIRRSSYAINPETFQLNLLALSALIIKADGKIEQRELDFVRSFFIGQYGKERADSIFRNFNTQIKKEAQRLDQLTQVFVQQTAYETRLQILHFLFGIANADGHVSNVELEKLSQIASGMRLRLPDFESIKAMFVKNTDNAYKILEIESNASQDDIKKAYRRMAKKYHPDKLRGQDPAMIKGAEEKFREVQKAYETLIRLKNN
ncbi:DnaJ domain-containing protein [Flavobacteriaceae bacterium]|nr:TerB family tellurite resistance protein [Flavobacteriaceae bacterium]MDA8763521.1 DnaJ domain-containing protein [Flavobacteriaceae bacterium]MDC0478750.1 DnaJ domain-containing protein [Flavobacteriaceae bacterium]